MGISYKVVETDIVTDDKLEEILNKWTKGGWIFQGIQFAMRESSRRPAMAFIIFNREVADETSNGVNETSNIEE